MSIKVVGIDLAKNFFQVCVLNIDGTISSNRKVSLIQTATYNASTSR